MAALSGGMALINWNVDTLWTCPAEQNVMELLLSCDYLSSLPEIVNCTKGDFVLQTFKLYYLQFAVWNILTKQEE